MTADLANKSKENEDMMAPNRDDIYSHRQMHLAMADHIALSAAKVLPIENV